MNKNKNIILTDKYYIIQEPICKWYMTDEPIGKTQYIYEAESWNTKELAANWLLGNVPDSDSYKIIEVETTFKEI